MMDYYKNNIELLRKNDPELAAAVDFLYHSENIEIFSAKNNQPTAKMKIDDKEILLHSAYNPGKEADRLIESRGLDKESNVALFGNGLGYDVLAILEEIKNHCDVIFVFESSADMFKHSLEHLDMTSVLSDKRVVWIVEESRQIVHEKIGKYRQQLITNGIKFVANENAMKMNPEWYNIARQELLDIIRHGFGDVYTGMIDGRDFQSNIISNIPYMLTSSH